MLATPRPRAIASFLFTRIIGSYPPIGIENLPGTTPLCVYGARLYLRIVVLRTPFFRSLEIGLPGPALAVRYTQGSHANEDPLQAMFASRNLFERPADT